MRAGIIEAKRNGNRRHREARACPVRGSPGPSSRTADRRLPQTPCCAHGPPCWPRRRALLDPAVPARQAPSHENSTTASHTALCAPRPKPSCPVRVPADVWGMSGLPTGSASFFDLSAALCAHQRHTQLPSPSQPAGARLPVPSSVGSAPELYRTAAISLTTCPDRSAHHQ